MAEAREIAAEFRNLLESYFRAVDAWEQSYGQYYRLSRPEQVSADMEPQHRDLEKSRKALERALPAAQVLCHRYRIRENWSRIVKLDFNRGTPQNGAFNLVGRGERNLAMSALIELELAALTGESSPPKPKTRRGGIVGFLLDLF